VIAPIPELLGIDPTMFVVLTGGVIALAVFGVVILWNRS